VLLVVALAPAIGLAQQVLDRVIVRFGSEMVTQLDVRQARLLDLVPQAGPGEEAIVDALVNRKLILAELRRSGGPEPDAEAIEARYREWKGRLGAGVDVSERLTEAGTTEASVRGWLRDDLRIQAYLKERFGGRQGDIDNWVAVLRQRAGVK
jgi:hypothetical protein